MAAAKLYRRRAQQCCSRARQSHVSIDRLLWENGCDRPVSDKLIRSSGCQLLTSSVLRELVSFPNPARSMPFLLSHPQRPKAVHPRVASSISRSARVRFRARSDAYSSVRRRFWRSGGRWRDRIGPVSGRAHPPTPTPRPPVPSTVGACEKGREAPGQRLTSPAWLLLVRQDSSM